MYLELSQIRVKSRNFGRSAKFGQQPCLFHILIIVIKKLIKLTNSENPGETAHCLQMYVHCLQMYVPIYQMSEATQIFPIYRTDKEMQLKV